MNHILSLCSRLCNSQSLLRLLQRFSLPIIEVFILTALFLYYINADRSGDMPLLSSAIYYFSVGSLLSLSLCLWDESSTMRKSIKRGIKLLLQVLWFLCSLYFYLNDGWSYPFFLSYSSICAFISISIVWSSFLRTHNDLPFWNFTIRIIGRFLSSLSCGFILCCGICLLAVTLEQLFNVDLPYKYYSNICLVCLCTLPTLLFLMQIPETDEKTDYEIRIFPFVNFCTRYLLIPLVGAYLLVLYIYALRILFLWQLPKGWVSLPVSVLMLGAVLVIGLLYPMQMQASPNSFYKRLGRWLPVFTLPLLFLMSIGVFRRISDYGITIPRLYLLVFNIWCYAVLIGLFFMRSKRIQWIPITFSVVFLLCSIGPWSIEAVTRRTLTKELNDILSETGTKPRLPMNEKTFDAFFKSLSAQKRYAFVDKLYYLSKNYADTVRNSFITKDVYLYSYYSCDTFKYTSYTADISSNLVEIPQGYKRIGKMDYNNTKFSAATFDKGIIPIATHIHMGEKDIRIESHVPLLTLKGISKQDGRQLPLILSTNHKEIDLLVTGFSLYAAHDGTNDGNISCNGYVLFRN